MTEARVAVTPDSVYLRQWTTMLAGLLAVTPREGLGVREGDVVLVVGAHPDDETLGFGASIASMTRSGVSVHALSLSAGEAAVDHLGRSVDHLGARRATEFSEACLALGAASWSVGGLPDGRLGEHPDALRSVVIRTIERVGADQVVTVWGRDPHADHQAVGKACSEAAAATGCRVSAYPVWAPHWLDPAGPAVRGHSLQPMRNDTDAEAARQVALQCYSSQTEPLMDDVEPVLPPSVVQWTTEILVTV